ncbi:hypothetical protein FBD94_07875 [Pedobacter hiemivivus]|uniref:Uncharacterized protein n=1 Tax=Pedobacter hiemivivus TaxID=2530454 RepID=A0A4U1GEH7_9SPHI|nr:hypothetical protein [Pedobacter hiemivivus]TKC62134.1 hypothetical protein FBD94_07875 [Pedobacter hiemivivus]
MDCLFISKAFYFNLTDHPMEKKGKKSQNSDPDSAARISNSAGQPAQKTTEEQEKPKQQNALSRPHILFK